MSGRQRLTAQTCESATLSRNASPARRSSGREPGLARPLSNQLLQSLLRSGAIQAKLTVNTPGDVYEQEADRVADTVLGMRDQAAAEGNAPGPVAGPPIQRQCAECAEEEEIQRQTLDEEPEAAGEEGESASSDRSAPEGEEEDGSVLLKSLSSRTPQPGPALARSLAQSKGGGQPLPEGFRTSMESRLGADFSRVRVHTDGRAASLTRDLQATAFTHGRDLYFGPGRYAPESRSGQWLLAHELTHVVQQGGSGARKTPAMQRAPLRISPLRAGSQGFLQRQAEVHVNLRHAVDPRTRAVTAAQSVKLYQRGGTDRVFSPVSAGPNTEPLSGRRFRLSKRADPTAQIGKWGLQYFAAFRGGIGFHSNIAYPRMRTLCAEGSSRCDRRGDQDRRVRIVLVVDGTPRSHGCVRMLPTHAEALFNAVSNGT